MSNKNQEKKKNKIGFKEFFKRYYKFIFLAIGLVGIVVMIIQSDPKNVDWSLFLNKKIIVILVGCFLTWIVIYCLHTSCYKVMLKEERKNIPFRSMFKICWTGFALNNVTPAGLVGGEPYRIMELKRFVSKEKSTGATLCFTLFYTVGHLMLWLTGVIVYFARGLASVASTWISVLLGISGSICLIIIVLFLTCRNHGFVYPFMKGIAKLPGLKKKIAPKIEAKAETYKNIDQVIINFRHEGWRFALVLIFQYITRLLEAFEYFLLIKYFAADIQHVSYLDGLLVMSTCSLIGNLLFIIPMQAGTREGGMAIALGFLFSEIVLKSIAVPVGILYRFREITFTVIGIILVAITKKNRESKAVE